LQVNCCLGPPFNGCLLHMLILQRSTNSISMLLELNKNSQLFNSTVDINIVNSIEKNTPLHYAVATGNAAIVQVSLICGSFRAAQLMLCITHLVSPTLYYPPCITHLVSLTLYYSSYITHLVSPTLYHSPCITHLVSLTLYHSPCLTHLVLLTSRSLHKSSLIVWLLLMWIECTVVMLWIFS